MRPDTGRAWLGIGAGYNVDEAKTMGLFLPETAERFARLSELLALARQMWSGDETPYHGEYLRLERPIGSPLPVTSPRPPVLIGGTGERRTLRLVAQYGDACNLFDIPDGGNAIRHQLEVLARHCADVGRPVDEVERTVTTALEQGSRPISSSRAAARWATSVCSTSWSSSADGRGRTRISMRWPRRPISSRVWRTRRGEPRRGAGRRPVRSGG